MNRTEFIADAKRRIIAAGLTIGPASVWVEDKNDYVYISSREYGNGGMWSSPKAEATWNEGRMHYTSAIR